MRLRAYVVLPHRLGSTASGIEFSFLSGRTTAWRNLHMKRGTLASNLLWLGGATVVSMLANMVYTLLVARSLGPYEFGRFALVVGVGSWLVSLAQGGSSTALMVLAAEEPQRASFAFWPGLVIHAMVGVGSLCVSLLVVWVLSSDQRLLFPSLLFGVAMAGSLLASVPISIYRGLNQMKWAAGTAAAGVLTVILMFFAGTMDSGVAESIAANTVSQATLSAVLILLAIRSFGIRRLDWNAAVARRLALASMVLWAVTVVQASHWRVGLVTVQVLAGASGVGIYSAGIKLVETLRTIPWFLLMAVLPALVQAGREDSERLRVLISQALRYLLLIAFPLYSVLAILSPRIIEWLYSAEFAPSASVLRIAAVGLLPLFTHWVFLNALVALRKERQLVICYAVSILVEVILDCFLVPMWGTEGAAIGYLVGESTAALVSGWYVARFIGVFEGKLINRVFVPGAIAVVLAWLPANGASTVFRAAIVLVVYICTAFMSKAITLSEVRNFAVQFRFAPSNS